MKCATCNGKGAVPDPEDERGLVVCDDCDGAGEISDAPDVGELGGAE